MTIIAMPASVRIRRVVWSPDRPAQVNRSAYTGARRVVANPWHGKWSAQVELAPIVGEANVRPWRAFLASLKGQINTFQLRATEGAQHVLGTANAVVQNHANTTVTPQGSGVYRVTKSGATSAYDADATSATGVSGDFAIRIKPVVGGNDKWGVSVTPLANSSDIDTGLQFTTGGTVYKQEGGTATAIGTFTYASDYLFLRRVGTTVTILKGSSTDVTLATLLGTISYAVSGVVFFDCSIFTPSNSADVLVSYTQTFATLASTAAQGATTASLTGAATLTAGMLATFALPSGNYQLVTLTQDISAGVITFEPPLREAVSTGAIVETANPTCQVALADSAFSWSVDPGTQYGIAFNVEEAF